MAGTVSVEPIDGTEMAMAGAAVRLGQASPLPATITVSHYYSSLMLPKQ
jgi:hypothetical protein